MAAPPSACDLVRGATRAHRLYRAGTFATDPLGPLPHFASYFATRTCRTPLNPFAVACIRSRIHVNRMIQKTGLLAFNSRAAVFQQVLQHIEVVILSSNPKENRMAMTAEQFSVESDDMRKQGS